MSITEVDAARDRVRAWIAASDLPKAAIAARANVDEKTVRQAVSDEWNPTVKTLAKLQALIPAGWHAGDPLPTAGPAATPPAGEDGGVGGRAATFPKTAA